MAIKQLFFFFYISWLNSAETRSESSAQSEKAPPYTTLGDASAANQTVHMLTLTVAKHNLNWNTLSFICLPTTNSCLRKSQLAVW